MLPYLLQFLSGAFAANAVLHLVHGMSGKTFRTPFVRFSRSKVSGPVVNVLWGAANLIASYFLFAAWQSGPLIAAFALGALAMGLLSAQIFAGDHQS